MDKVSVAMTTYNGSKFIIEQLDSIRSQSQIVNEVIISDDRSTDNTVSLVRDYITQHGLLNWSIQVNEINKGFADNFMDTVRLCSGSLILLADQDDVWYSDKVKLSVEFMNENPSVMSMASAYDVCDSDGSLMDMTLLDEWRADDGGVVPIKLSYFLNGKSLRGASMCFRKSILADEPVYKIGSFGHDNILSIYAILKGSAVFYSRILMKYRVHDANTSNVSLGKDSRFSIKKLTKRLKFLNDSKFVTKILSVHGLLAEKDRVAFLRRLDFLTSREKLIKKVSVSNVVASVGFIGDYVANSPRGLIGGWYTYFTDILFAIRYNRQDKVSND